MACKLGCGLFLSPQLVRSKPEILKTFCSLPWKYSRQCIQLPCCSLFTIRLNCLGTSWQTRLNKLFIFQKRALRFMCFRDRCDHTIPLFFHAQTSLAEIMHNVSDNIVPLHLKDLFIPTVKIHLYNTPSSVSNNSVYI